MTAVLPDPDVVARAPTAQLGGGRLLRAELNRLCRRRLVQALAAIFFAGLVGVSAIAFFTHHTDIARARADAQQAYDANYRQYDQMVAEMKANGVPPEQIPPRESVGGRPEDYFQDPRYRAVDELPNVVRGVAAAWALFACMIGATFAGAEWAHKTMVALLIWEPRRLRVMAAKLAALVTGVAALGVLAQILAIGLGDLTARWRGTFDGIDGVEGGFWGPLLASAGRGVLLALMTAAIGFAVANLVRHTAAVLGIAFVYFAILEGALASLRPAWLPYLLVPNVGALLTRGGIDVSVPTGLASGSQEEMFRQVHLSSARGGLYLLAVTTVLVLVSTGLFRRRDLT
jgi:ABC-2 type transport system permease protein